MIKYITTINTPEITLDLMGRKKTFMNNQEVNGDAYTKSYPQYFKKIGEITGYDSYLAEPTYTAYPIEELTEKEDIRKVENSEIKEVDIGEIAEEKFDIEDVIFETEE